MGADSTGLTTTKIIMKSLILLAMVAFASATPTCDECIDAVGKIRDHLLTPESLGIQQAAAVSAGCPLCADPAACEAWIMTYWPKAAKVLFDWLVDVKDPCGELGLGYCKRDFTCGECLMALNLLSEIMVNQQYVDELVEYMQGPAYCGDGGDHIEGCPDVIAIAMPQTLIVLSQALPELSTQLCQESLGVC